MVGRTLDEIAIFVDLSFVKRRKKNYEVVKTKERLLYHINRCDDLHKAGKLLAGVDTETTGLDFNHLKNVQKSELIGICISYEDNQGIYIPIDHTEFDNIPIDFIVEHLLPKLEVWKCATHNGLFDYKVFYSLGCKLNIVHDSMLLLFNFFSKVSKGSKALKPVTKMLYGDDTIEFKDIFGDSTDYTLFRYVSEEVARVYACADADYCRKLVMDHYNKLSVGQKKTYLSDVQKMKMFSVSEYQGKPVDIELLQDYLKEIYKNISNLRELLFKFVGWKLTGDTEQSYIFKETSMSELSDVLYNKLGYNIVDIKGKTNYTIDSKVLKRLRDTGSEKDIDEYTINYCNTYIKPNIKNMVEQNENGEYEDFFDYKKFLKSKCKVADLLIELRKQEKYYTSFVKKIKRESKYAGWYFTSISMTNAETARIIDFIQTLAGNLKKLISVKNMDDKYIIIFDFSQIEYRVMIGLAALEFMTNKLNHSHTDFHKECAAWILDTKPKYITKEIRKQFKSMNFAIPYGMALLGMVEAMFGVGLTGKDLEEALDYVNDMYQRWKLRFPEVIKMLEDYRDLSTTPRKYDAPNLKLKYESSYITSPDGRVRVFDLNTKDNSNMSKIRRMSGNYPIQEFAGTIYKTAVDNLYKRLIKEGLTDIKVEAEHSKWKYEFKSYVTLNAYIHDELMLVVDNNVNAEYLCKLIYEECMIRIPGHPTYFCGINVCETWKDGKDGKYEMPIDFVKTLDTKEKFTDEIINWKEYMENSVVEFCNKDFIKYVESLLEEDLILRNKIDVTKLFDLWEDYYYDDKLYSYGVDFSEEINNIGTLEKEKIKLLNKTIGTLLAYKYDKLFIILNNKVQIVNKNGVKKTSINALKKDREIYIVSEDDDFLEDDVISAIYENNKNSYDKKYNIEILNTFLTTKEF